MGIGMLSMFSFLQVSRNNHILSVASLTTDMTTIKVKCQVSV